MRFRSTGDYCAVIGLNCDPLVSAAVEFFTDLIKKRGGFDIKTRNKNKKGPTTKLTGLQFVAYSRANKLKPITCLEKTGVTDNDNNLIFRCDEEWPPLLWYFQEKLRR